MPKAVRQAIEGRDEIANFMEQSHISRKNVARLRVLVDSPDAAIAALAVIVLEVAAVKPHRRNRLRFLARKHPELIKKLEAAGLIPVREDLGLQGEALENDFADGLTLDDGGEVPHESFYWADDDEDMCGLPF